MAKRELETDDDLDIDPIEYMVEDELDKAFAGWSDTDDDIYREPIPDMEEFCFSSKYMNGDGILQKDMRPRIFDVLCHIDNEKIREAYLGLGKGSGKSFVCSIILARQILRLLCFRDPIKYFGKTNLTALCLSISKEQAQSVIFREFNYRLYNAPWFKKKYKARSFSVSFPFGIRVVSGHSRSESFLGYNTLVGVMDEASHMMDTSQRSIAEDLYMALKGSMLTRFANTYKLILVSSVVSQEDFLVKQIANVQKDGIRFDIAGRKLHENFVPHIKVASATN